VNDLIGLRYGWGHRPSDGSGQTDCFQLTCEARRRLGMKDYEAQFSWVYEQYTDETFPRTKILRWLLQNGREISAPAVGAVLLLPGAAGAALGTVTDFGALFIGPGQSVIHVSTVPVEGRCFWMEP
jgi:hypothetical protein